ncbi:MAG: DUF2625 family protein [bacterium]|nr:DUF2625 family protein [bacterium]
MRSLSELQSSNPAWPLLSEWIGTCPHPVEVLEPDPDQAAQCLVALQVTDGSVLGGLAINSGGVLVDHGWLRLLGSGHPTMAGIHEANGLTGNAAPSGPLLVGYDAIGGRFVINDGTLSGEPGEMVFWAPDALAWEPLGVGHSAFVQMMMTDRLGAFYEQSRWPGWESELAGVDGNHGIFLYPPLFSVEGRDTAASHKGTVPLSELFDFYEESARQLGPGSPG